MTPPKDTESTRDEQLPEEIERMLRFNCPNGCDGQGSYHEMGSDGEWEQEQCQWCFEFGMPARESLTTYLDQQIAEAELNTLVDAVHIWNVSDSEEVFYGQLFAKYPNLKPRLDDMANPQLIKQDKEK